MTEANAALLARWNVGSVVISVAVSHDGTRVASGLWDGSLRLWDVNTGALVLEQLKGHTNWVRSVAFSPDDTRIVSGSDDCTVRLWDTRTGAPVGEPLRGHTGWVLSVAFSPDSSLIASGSEDRTLRIWDARTGAFIGQPLEGHTDWVFSVAFSPDSSCIISGSADHTIRIWDARTGALVGEPLRGHSGGVISVAFSTDSSCIVSGSGIGDYSIRIWDARTRTLIGEPLKGHDSAVTSVAFSSDSTRIVSCSNDRTICFWDVRTGTPIGEPLKGHTGVVNSVAFSPDSSHIFSGSDDRTICVWQVPQITPAHDTFTAQDSPSFDMVTSKMSAREMFDCLVKHGCTDLTSTVDAERHSSSVIASGGFGDVRRVTDKGRSFAVKTLRLHILLKDDDKAVKRAVREVYIWSRLHHRNIQDLLGIVVFQGGLGMVSLWMEKGNLTEYIAAHPDVERYDLCVQVASGVSYLHSIDMVHGDLKANNVLVSDDGTLKINDFDHAILSGATLLFSTTTRVGGGTLRWMAPELLQAAEEDENGEIPPPIQRSKQTDIYALGMTILEIFTGNAPYVEYHSDMGVYRAVDRRQPPRRPKVLSGTDERTTRTWSLLLQCWDHDPSVRPDASSVLKSLQSISSVPSEV